MESCKPVDLAYTEYTPVVHHCSKNPIIFMHGFFGTVRSWNSVKTKIANKTGRKVYCICLRNHYDSGWSKEFTINHLMADLENFMKEKNISRSILVAHSMGGRTALAFALKRPHMVEALVVEDMNLVDDERQLKVYKKTFDVARSVTNTIQTLPPSVSEMEVQKKFGKIISEAFNGGTRMNQRSRVPPMVLALHKDESGNFVWDVALQVILDLDFDDFQLDLSADPVFEGRTLFIQGAYSKICVEKDRDLIARHFPNSSLQKIKNVYHNCHAENSEKYIEHVSNFINEHIESEKHFNDDEDSL